MALQVMPVSEVKAHIGEVVERVSKSREPLYIARRSRVDVVMLSLDVYEAMLQDLEDAQDAELLRQARESGEPIVPFEEARQQLIAEGLLSDTV